MKRKLSEVEMVNYVDGTLEAGQLEEVEEYLRAHAEDAELMADMKLALEALHDWDEAEPMRVSDDFWPKLRDKLPEKPQRSWWRSMSAPVGNWLWPARLSVGAAVVAIVLAMASFLFAPKQAVNPVVATEIPADARAFIQKSIERHESYDLSQPLSGALPPVGDSRSAEQGDDEDSQNYEP